MLGNHILKTKKILEKVLETRVPRYIYQKKVGKACFQYDKAYYNFKGLPRRMGSDKITFNIVNKPKYDGYQRGLVSKVAVISSKNVFNEQLCKVYLSFKDKV